MNRLFPITLLTALFAFTDLPLHAQAAETYSIKLATVAPEGSPWDDSLKRFKKRVEAKSNGRLKLRVFLGGTLGDENQTVEQTKRGQIQVVGASTGALGSQVNEVNFLELPYLFRNLEEADYILDTVIGDELDAIFRERGFVVLMWSENGIRNFGTQYGFIKKPADMKSHKMRSQENPIHLSMYRAYGALPVPIPTTEVLSSLQTGVVDGYDQTPLFTFAIGLHNSTKYWTVSDHIYQPGAIVMNKEYFDKLPKDLQDILLEERRQDTIESRKGIRALTPLLIENLRASGLQVYTLTQAEKEVFAKASQPVYAEFEKTAPPRSKALYKKTVEALKKYRAGKK
jgi:tripartite ATP-independent transporter DctP family solute receptor